MICSGCLQLVQDCEEVITCTSDSCGQSYHAVCTNAQHLTLEDKNNWICPNCTAKIRKGGDNTHTPVRAGTENITLRKKNKQKSGTSHEISSPSALQVLSTEVNQLRESATDMWDTLKARLDDIAEKNIVYDARLQKLEKLERENIALKATVDSLQNQIDEQAQTALRNELEISGLEETAGENPYHLVLTTAGKLGVKLQDADLVHESRVGPKRQASEGSLDAKDQLQRPVVVAFVNRVKREEFLKQAKARRNLKSEDIVGQGPDRKVFVNERLTGTNRRLFRSARTTASEREYKYCWVRNGVIFIRKSEARHGSPAIRIRSVEDLANLPYTPKPEVPADPPAVESMAHDLLSPMQ